MHEHDKLVSAVSVGVFLLCLIVPKLIIQYKEGKPMGEILWYFASALVIPFAVTGVLFGTGYLVYLLYQKARKGINRRQKRKQ
jgi:hypothetical protein